MVRLVIVIAIAIVIVIAGSIIFKFGPPPVDDDDDDDSPLLPPVDADDDDDSPPLPPVDADDDDDSPGPVTVSVSINAIPWARVFIKLPENDYFMEPRAQDFTIPPEPNQKESNVTPIPGDLKVPVGTAIKLMYRDKEKIFLYDQWKDGKTISYDFLNQ